MLKASHAPKRYTYTLPALRFKLIAAGATQPELRGFTGQRAARLELCPNRAIHPEARNLGEICRRKRADFFFYLQRLLRFQVSDSCFFL